MRIVVRGEQDISAVTRRLSDIPPEGLLVEITAHKRPRTLSQCRKIHAMMDELGDFCGEEDMKGFIKGLAFWPTEIVSLMGVEVERPRSEKRLSAEDESNIIEHLYMIGSELDGFEWGEL